ncbi:MAG: bifunctional 1-(5-phosphoribosyl)-5-((5-phosphoribosylamino)methylideneamino)imidazole-4-carboxamide isomerase/phosphoribosylanthranilate isomerase PriA [Ilumatobacter sp.]|uniref:bifunctional 1-(5-phosphoribosyl)-5-((5- phosphoribosylamino)methylideneamino)imidazole-4- carboxamide isomerase/phosphoribosylanthranilate isomerase PriA n=1 Tax=Ilumatobacter sp. TaxID=1967498 RepID=UPI003C75C1E0
MSFTLFPAVDVADGQAVRLARGTLGTETAHGTPLDAALAWQADGAAWIHLVDLDAAFGTGSNAELLAAVIDDLDVHVQLSGGITDDGSLTRALATGCSRVNLATTALDDRAFCSEAFAVHGKRIAVSLDVRISGHPDGRVRHHLAARGSSREGGDLWDTIEWLDRAGCARYVITDVDRDGMLAGPNLDLHRAVADATSTPVIASGGIASIDDVTQLARSGARLDGAVLGKALYAGRFTLPEALDAVGRTP